MKKDTNQKGTGKQKPKTLRERVNKHLADKNDIITEEDMKNIKVGEDGVVEEQEQSEELAKAITDRKITSPWNVLTEDDK